MKKCVRKLMIMGVVLILCFGILCACDKNDDDTNDDNKPNYSADAKGEFYTLQEAYDNGFMTVDDLNIVAERFYNRQPLNIDDVDADAFKAMQALFYNQVIDEKDSQGEYENLDFKLEYAKRYFDYYGEFDGSYCMRVRYPNSAYPGIMIEKFIGGVRFYYSEPFLMVWKD